MNTIKNTAQALLRLPSADHRHIGIRQKLFFFNDLSQGSCFFEPRGARILNKLVEFLRNEYKQRGYDEVITPNIYSCEMWETSGHWQHYKENMIRFKVSDNEYSLKPMNCPGHCLMFKHQNMKNSNQLPVRWADFGVLHRNELSGSLIGLTRGRKFQQDDAHIFCTPQQVESEVKGCLDFANFVYGEFDFTFDVALSLRPKEYLGESELWDKAEGALRAALSQSNQSWVEQKFEGAFYGPKIDLIVKDTRQRSQQCATIQLDFQLPERFGLEYRDIEGKSLARPVIIHRAILGSLERFISMLAENNQGRWPFWLSPLQAQVIPIHESLNDYAEQICKEFRELGFWVDCDLGDSRLNSKVREAVTMPYNLIFVVGEQEASNRTVTARIMTGASGADIGLDQQEANTSAKKRVQNLSISLDALKELFVEFERRRIRRADIELLRHFAPDDVNKVGET